MIRYKRFTLIAQSLGAIITAYEAVLKLRPAIFIGNH